MDETGLHAYIGLLILAGPEVRLQLVYGMQRVEGLIRFDDRESRPARRATDKLAVIREVWDKWVERLPYLYNPGPDLTVDKQLVPFRGCATVSMISSVPELCRQYLVTDGISTFPGVITMCFTSGPYPAVAGDRSHVGYAAMSRRAAAVSTEA
ncbi:hypothetical protein N1851_009502 [Merluccius polli]|uniref:PiggyBac transposable element-derived protein domain-containing protein n=1 Tax=Merluccius polli TaxID=89951 RepID=A0AA47MZY7_MERPO|nr:hypothetical protein N1851_009502 [Merluccius polli]